MMRTLRVSFEIWEKQIKFKIITWGIKEDQRKVLRGMRQEQIRNLRIFLIEDLLNRNRIGDIRIDDRDKELLYQLRRTPTISKIEGIYKKYL
jgi:hypothetical protein